nr:hypothetical protein [Tanacetum cinerariifolium]
MSKRCHPSNLRIPRGVLQRPKRRSGQKNGQRQKRPRCAKLDAMCQKIERERGNMMKTKGFWDAVIKYFEKETGTTRGSASGGFNLNNKADESEEDIQEKKRLMGRDRAKAKKKSSASSREGSSSFVDLNRELDIREAERREAAELKREKLAIQRRTLELAEREKWTKTSYSIIQKAVPLCPQYNDRSCRR